MPETLLNPPWPKKKDTTHFHLRNERTGREEPCIYRNMTSVQIEQSLQPADTLEPRRCASRDCTQRIPWI